MGVSNSILPDRENVCLVIWDEYRAAVAADFTLSSVFEQKLTEEKRYTVLLSVDFWFSLRLFEK